MIYAIKAFDVYILYIYIYIYMILHRDIHSFILYQEGKMSYRGHFHLNISLALFNIYNIYYNASLSVSHITATRFTVEQIGVATGLL